MSMLVWEQAEGCAAWNVNGFWSRNWVVRLLFDLILLSARDDLNQTSLKLKEGAALNLKDVTCEVGLVIRQDIISALLLLFSQKSPVKLKALVVQLHHFILDFWLMF